MNLFQKRTAIGIWSISFVRPLRLFESLVLVCGTLVLSPQLALGQFLPQGKLPIGSDAIGAAEQGTSVALSADGTTIIIGGQNDNGGNIFNPGVGAAWVYTFSNGAWTQQSKLIGPQAIGLAGQGRSVALSSDGTFAIVGGLGDNNGAGAAWIFTLSNGVATQPGFKLPLGTGAIGAANQGASVALSADGKTAIVGGPTDNNDTGAAWVYTFDRRAWTRQSKLVVNNATDANFGSSVALSADGTTAIVGGQNYNTGVGAAWVYTLSNGAPTGSPFKLSANDAVGEAGQGTAVALSADGTTAIVGGFTDNTLLGAAWIYTLSNGMWTQQAKLFDQNAVEAGQGMSVALSPDGKTAIVGGGGYSNSAGAAWVYALKKGTWQQQSKLIGQSAIGPASQGASVALSADNAVVGGPYDNNYAGAAWVYGQLAVHITAKSPIYLGQTSTLEWSTANVATCTASGSPGVSSVWSGSEPTGTHSQVVNPPAVSTYVYTLTCQSADGNNSASDTAYVTVNEVPHITHLPACAPLCITEFLGAGGSIQSFGQLPTSVSGAMVMTRSGTVDAVEVSREGDRNVTTITVSPNSSVEVLGDLGEDFRIVKADVDRSTFLDRLRNGTFGAAPWIKRASGDPGAKPNIVGVAFRGETLSGLMVAGKR